MHTSTPADPVCLLEDEPEASASRRGTRRRGDDSGFILPTFAIILIALVAMAGFGIDVWSWWYTGQQAQRAADAGALSGVVFLPDDMPTATTTARAATTANGFTTGVTVEGGTQANQLVVDVERTVSNTFTKLLGVPTTTITRSATAEYTGRVNMGSPTNKAGQDPDTPASVVDFWLSDSGRASTKQGGDRYQSNSCSQQVFNCPGSSNPEYAQNGYTFTVRANASSVAAPLVIEIFDPAQIPFNRQDCGEAAGAGDTIGDSMVPRNFNLAELSSLPTVASVTPAIRYGDPLDGGGTPPASKKFCVGDVENVNQGAGLNPASFNPTTNPNQTSTFVVRAPDNTPASDLDNPIVSTGTCAPKQFAPWSADGSATGYYGYLDPNDNYRDGAGGSNRGNRRTVVNGAYSAVTERDAFLNEYRRWVRVCEIPRATANTMIASGGRDFVVQVLSNVPYLASGTLSDPLVRTSDKGGRNHFSIRATAGSTDVDVFANGRLPMAVAARGANTTFYLAKVGTEQANRTLSVEFFDVGDASATGTITIQKGVGSTGSAFTCTFSRIDQNNNNSPPTSSGCQLQNVNSGTGYQGSVTTALVKIPPNYTCNSTNLSCWVTIVFAYPASGGEVLDHTVWSAGVVGDPVRLVK